MVRARRLEYPIYLEKLHLTYQEDIRNQARTRFMTISAHFQSLFETILSLFIFTAVDSMRGEIAELKSIFGGIVQLNRTFTLKSPPAPPNSLHLFFHPPSQIHHEIALDRPPLTPFALPSLRLRISSSAPRRKFAPLPSQSSPRRRKKVSEIGSEPLPSQELPM